MTRFAIIAALILAVIVPASAAQIVHPLPLLSPTLAGLKPIPDRVASSLIITEGRPIPASAAPDLVGAFRFICLAGQLARLDPLVNFGGVSMHGHQFFGAMNVTATSTYASLRTTPGGSTCANTGQNYTGNSSAYWMPWMEDGKGNVVRPDYVSIYYKARPQTDPVVSNPANPRYQGKMVPLPVGLNFIFGRNMLNLADPATGGFYFNCQGPTARGGTYRTKADLLANCPTAPNAAGVRNQVGIIGTAPSCWNGRELDTADHRSHMAYPAYGTWGYQKCPVTHPYVIPHFTMGTWYTVDDNLPTWELSSNRMFPNEPPWSTYHADFMMAHPPASHNRWNGPNGCLNKMLNCASGHLGDGGQLIGAMGTPFKAIPRLVPVP